MLRFANPQKTQICSATELEYDIHSFTNDIHYHAYKFCGAQKNKSGFSFTLWAPQADAISLVSDFNNWGCNANPLKQIKQSGFWSTDIPNLQAPFSYQYLIHYKDGSQKLVNDPFSQGFYNQGKFATAVQPHSFIWNDQNWIDKQSEQNPDQSKISILDFDLNNFRYTSQTTYQEIIKNLISLCQECKFTHIRLNNFFESTISFDNDTCSQDQYLFCANTAFGSSSDFKCLINFSHQNNIGIIIRLPYLDENSKPNFGNFKNFTKKAHFNFYLSNLVYWLEEFHIDGFDFAKLDNIFANNNKQVWEFYQKANNIIKSRNSQVLSFATESTNTQRLTKTSENNLGFDFKMNYKLDQFLHKQNQVTAKDFLFNSCNLFSENHIHSLASIKSFESKLTKTLFCLISFLPGKTLNHYEQIKNNIAKDSLFRVFMKKTSRFFHKLENLDQVDFSLSNFEWVFCDNEILSCIRWNKNLSHFYLLVANFGKNTMQSCALPVTRAGFYQEIFNSDVADFGGTNINNEDGVYSCCNQDSKSNKHCIHIDIGGESCLIFSSPVVPQG